MILGLLSLLCFSATTAALSPGDLTSSTRDQHHVLLMTNQEPGLDRPGSHIETCLPSQSQDLCGSLAGLCIGQTDRHGDGSLTKPTLSAWPSSVVPTKSSVTLRCSSPIPWDGFILRKGSVVLDTRPPLDSTETTSEFHLTELGPRSAGWYTCECFRRGYPHVTSQPSNVLLLLVTGYLPRPSLQIHQVGKVTTGGEVTLQCQMPNTAVAPLESALLKAGTPSPVQVHRPVGRETDFSLQGMTVRDTGTYSCIYYQAKPPFWASDPSPPLDILVTAPPGTPSEGYTKGNLVRLGVAAVVLLILGVLLLEAWHTRGQLQVQPEPPPAPQGAVNPGRVGPAGLGERPVPPALPAP